jgi:hypothetical protein
VAVRVGVMVDATHRKEITMLGLLWNLSAAIRGYLRFYMPTNRALDWLRSPRGLSWAIPAALVATPTYLYAMSFAAVVAERPGLGYVNLLVLLFCWNAVKFAWVAVLAPFSRLSNASRRSAVRTTSCRCVGAPR